MCQLCVPALSKEQFAERLVNLMNQGGLALMISIGHRTGLFDAMSQLPPSTSEEIARAAGLHERYVREWLGAMTTGGIVQYDPPGRRYALPAGHAAHLTRAAAADNLAVLTQYFAVLGSVEDEVVACFRRGGGVPYSAYKRFQPVMAEDSGQLAVSALVDSILPLAPGVLGALEDGMAVLDVGCGSGRALNFLARRFPKSRFTGFDLSEEAIATARGESARAGLRNVAFEVRDLSRFDTEAPPCQFDLITAFDAIHDQARPDRVLAGIARAIQPGGTFLMQDIAGSSDVHKNLEHPLGPLLYTISCMHCMTVSLAQGGLGLGAMWGQEKALEMLAEAGFDRVSVHHLPHDLQNAYYVARLN